MRAFVTGSTGFVGQHLVEHLLQCGDTVLGTSLGKTNQNSKCELVDLDITDTVKCATALSVFKPDVIYHLAGQAFVPDAENNFDATLLLNVGGTSVIARSAHLMHRASKIVFISSAEVYGNIQPGELPINENCAVRPQNNYSLSKAMAEMVIERYARAGTLQTVIARSFNHIGPGQDPRFVASSFAQQLALIAKKKHEPVIRVGNLDAKRDFTDVRDIVRAYRLAGEKGKGIYNLGSGRSIRISDLLRILIEVSGLAVTIEQDPQRMRPAEVPEVYSDISKAKRELGWEPKFEIKETLHELFRYWVERV